MNSFLTRLAISALALLAAAPAFAQWGDWYVAPSVVYNDDDPDRNFDDSLSGLEVAVGRDFSHWLSLEGRLAYSDINGYYLDSSGSYYRAKEPQIDLGAHVLAYYNRDAVFALYGMFGVGYQKANLGLVGKEQNPTASLGAGFKWRLGSSRFSVRTEVRMRRTIDGGGRNFTDTVATLGLQYNFGAAAGTTSYQDSDTTRDSDRDGVLDIWDECPGTAPGAEVTSRGCSTVDMTRDDDGDRVPNYRDECPETLAGMPVDRRGCSLDSDMDGVLTGDDLCPATTPGATVNEFGCEMEVISAANDRDGDTIMDDEDRCPETRQGARVDVYGCEIVAVINLPTISFATGADRMAPGSEDLLREAANTLNRNPNIMIEVTGHSDNVGDPDQNLGLSDRRAKTVLDYLVNFGVDPSRLTYRGYGEMLPIADNATARGRAMNRRVELRIRNR